MQSNINDICYEGEEIILGGKPRRLLYTNRGMKILAQKFGTVIQGLNVIREINYSLDEKSLDNICLLLYAGLMHEDKNLTLDDVENMFTFQSMWHCMEKITKAVTCSLPQVTEGNAQTQSE